MRMYTSPRGASVPMTDDNAIYVFRNGVAVSADHTHRTYFYLPLPFRRSVDHVPGGGDGAFDRIMRSMGGERVHTGSAFARMHGIEG